MTTCNRCGEAYITKECNSCKQEESKSENSTTFSKIKNSDIVRYMIFAILGSITIIAYIGTLTNPQ